MSSPMIRYFEKMGRNYTILAMVAAPFTILHAYWGLWVWFWIGLGVSIGSMYVAIRSAMEIDDLTHIAKVLDEARKKKIKSYYNHEED